MQKKPIELSAMKMPEPTNGSATHEAKSRFCASEQGASGPNIGAYTAKPDFSTPACKNKHPKKWLLTAIATVAIGIGAGLYLTNQNSPGPAPGNVTLPIASVVKAQSVFSVSDRDLDIEATELAKNALKEGRIPATLINVPEKTRQELLSGEQSLYSVRFLDFADADGDAMAITLNDMAFGEVVLSNSGAKLTVPLKKGESAKLTFLASRDGGGGGVTFRGISSIGEMRTRNMAVGEMESWTIAFK